MGYQMVGCGKGEGNEDAETKDEIVNTSFEEGAQVMVFDLERFRVDRIQKF